MTYKEWLEKVKDMSDSELEQYMKLSDSEFDAAIDLSSSVPHN